MIPELSSSPVSAKPAASSSDASLPPGLILFGRDAKQRPHASCFLGDTVEAAAQAAKLMGLQILPLRKPAQRALAAELPEGRIYPASGRAYVPFVEPTLFARLLAVVGKDGAIAVTVKTEANGAGGDIGRPHEAAAKPGNAAPAGTGSGSGAPAAVCIAASTSSLDVIMFGRDDKQRPHASRFASQDAEAAARAAALMGMHTLAIADDRHRALAALLPAGRIFPASGKAFVPFCKPEVFERLLAAAGLPEATMPAEAVGKPAEAALPATGGQAAAEGAGGGGGADRPSDWDDIGRGSVVLACCGPMEGWFEAVIEYTKANDSFTLRWRDWPLEPTIVRRRGELGLLPPDGSVGLK